MNRSTDTQQRILNSARELIYASSYADVGVASICEHAGVKKGSFYHFFPSKSELTQAVLDTFFLDMKESIFSQAFIDDLAPLEQIKKMAQLVYEFQQQTRQQTGHVLGCPFGNLATELSTTDEPIRKKVAEIFQRLQDTFVQLLEKAVAQGDVFDIDAKATAAAMLAYFEGVLMMAKTRNDAEIVRQLLPAVAQIRIPK
jgi:TetR/AcrR family transcriptional repressor of nem operon